MTDFQKKKKKGLFGSKKNKLGLSLRWKKTFFGPKIGKKLSIRTKFDQFFPKKDSLGQKLWKKWSSSVKNWQISPQKLSFGARIGKQLRIQAKKIDQLKKKIVLFQRELKKIIPKGIKKVLFPKNSQNKSSPQGNKKSIIPKKYANQVKPWSKNGLKFSQNWPKTIVCSPFGVNVK